MTRKTFLIYTTTYVEQELPDISSINHFKSQTKPKVIATLHRWFSKPRWETLPTFKKI